jgi:nucleotide-binding universal stress UspA family protein
MHTESAIFSRTTPARGEAPAATLGPLLVATDGRPAADAALRAARLLAGRTNADVHVVSVVDALALPSPESGAFPDAARFDEERRAGRLSAVREQLRRVAGEVDWPVEVLTGPPARTLARLAAERGAAAIVVGRRRRRWGEQLLGAELVLRLSTLADVPVLAVAPELTELPRRVVVAVDFSPYSLRAARAAVALLREFATLYLVFVALPLEVPDSWVALTVEYEARMADDLRALGAELGAPPDVLVEPVVLRGDPARALLEFGRASRAELVAAGTHGRGFFHRLVLGSVSTRLVRGAECSVLVVPPPTDAIVPEREGGPGASSYEPPDDGEVDEQARDVRHGRGKRPPA